MYVHFTLTINIKSRRSCSSEVGSGLHTASDASLVAGRLIHGTIYPHILVQLEP